MKDKLLRRGYFPKELPPLFQSREFADFVKEQGGLELTRPHGLKHLISRPAVHNLARPGQLRRKLQVPNPLNQFEIVDIMSNRWAEIEEHLARSHYSASKPKETPHIRALVTEKTGNELPKLRSDSRAVGRFLIRTDISRFYHSIYTHSIPWALKGKAWAKIKTNRSGGLANELDRALRNAQDGQTLGIPIGPDTSLVIAEIIGAAIDARIQDKLPCGFRFMDDFDVSFSSRAEAELGLVRIEEALAEFELGVNPLKTSIDKLPHPLERKWVNDIRQYDVNQSSVGETELLRYFSHVFELTQAFPFEPVLAYAVGRLRSIEVDENLWPTYQNLLYQCAVGDPASLATIVGQMFRHASFGISDRLDTVLNEIITTHSPLGHASEVVWAIWTACFFVRTLSPEAEAAATALDDPFVSLMVLLAYDRMVFPGNADHDVWRTRVADTELYEKNWLLAYEARRQGWLGSLASRNDVPVASDFGRMLAKDVSFLDLTTEVPVGYLNDVTGYGDLVDLDQERDTSAAF